VNDETFEIEADTLETAEQIVRDRTPAGHRPEIRVICDGKPTPRTTRTIEVTAESITTARHLAQQQIPEGYSKIAEEVVSDSSLQTVIGSGPDQATAHEEAKRQLPEDFVVFKVNSFPREMVVNEAYFPVKSREDESPEAAELWRAGLQRSLGFGASVSPPQLEDVWKPGLFGRLRRSGKTWVANFEAPKRVEVEISFHPKIVLRVLFGRDFITAKAKVVARYIVDQPASVTVATSAASSAPYRDGETVNCGKCGRAVKVKYHEKGKIALVDSRAIQTLALKCQDCGFVVCHSCTLGPSGEGMAVCPSCKVQGGPYFFTA
jgi:hypothetical protein